jgi:hypothetical protein
MPMFLDSKAIGDAAGFRSQSRFQMLTVGIENWTLARYLIGHERR